MENSILNNIGFDPGFLIIGLSVLTLISLIVTIICLSQYKKLCRRYDMFMYNAFKGMGGNLSFVIALLDDNNTGFVLNSVHSREGCYLYMKDVVEGKTEVLLGSEEKEALERALGYH